MTDLSVIWILLFSEFLTLLLSNPYNEDALVSSISNPIINTTKGISKGKNLQGLTAKAEALKENLRAILEHHSIAKMHYVPAKEKR